MKASFRVERQKLALCARFSKDCVFLRKIVQGFSSGWYVFVFVILLCLVSIVFYHPSWKRRSFYFCICLCLCITVVGRGMPAASPQAATVPLCFTWHGEMGNYARCVGKY